jgi:heme exporter protein C
VTRRHLDRALGPTALVLVVLTVWLGLWVTPPDEVQGNLVRLLYLHPAVAWVALYLAFGLAALSSALYLWPRTRSQRWDLLAASAVEVGVVFLTLTLATGMLWGRPVWGVWWTWDPRLTSTALLEVPIVHYSVQWWNGLHQTDSVLVGGFHFTIHGSMLWTLLLSFVAMSAVFVWMVKRRYEIAVRESAIADAALEGAVLERRKEGVR